VGEIHVVSIIASAPGVERVHREFPDVVIHAAAVDPELNDRKFIVPGLGDAGDRAFHTA
jgi:uracil phosphoribosyltransferase